MSPLLTWPSQDRAEADCRTIGDREFVIACCQPSPLFDVGEGALDVAPVFVPYGVKCRRFPATVATLLPGCDLVLLLKDHRLDAAVVQVLTVGSGPIGPVAENRVRACACTASADPWDSNISEHLRQYDSVVALAVSDHDRQWSTPTVNGMMDLRRQSAT